MLIDLSGLFEAIWQDLRVIPTPILVVLLLGGPTAALIGYRLIVSPDGVEAPAVREALWICRDCRSANQLRVLRCYRCGLERDATADMEFVQDRPVSPFPPYEAPAGSLFASVAVEALHRAAVPVMADQPPPGDPVAVGPGRDDEANAPVTPARREPAVSVEGDK